MEIFVLWIICCVVGIVADKSKGYSGAGGFWLSFLLGPIGVLIVLLWPNKRQDKPRETEDGDEKTCPHCRSLIPEAASVCRYCQRDVSLTKKKESEESKPILQHFHSLPEQEIEQETDAEKNKSSETHKMPSLASSAQSASCFQDPMFLVCGGIIVFAIILGLVAGFSSQQNSASGGKAQVTTIDRVSDGPDIYYITDKQNNDGTSGHDSYYSLHDVCPALEEAAKRVLAAMKEGTFIPDSSPIGGVHFLEAGTRIKFLGYKSQTCSGHTLDFTRIQIVDGRRQENNKIEYILEGSLRK